MTRFRFLCILPLFIIISACSTIKLSPITVSIVELKKQGSTLSVTVNYVSPNTHQLPVVEQLYTFEINGKTIGKFDCEKPVGIPSVGTVQQTFTLPRELSGQILASIPSNGGPVAYTLKSRLYIQFGDETYTAYASGSGEISLSE